MFKKLIIVLLTFVFIGINRSLHPVVPAVAVAESNVEAGHTLRYQITIRNPNDFAIENYLIVSELDLDLVNFVPGSVRVNGQVANYSFSAGGLNIYLATLVANNSYVINFEVMTLSDNVIPQTARLYSQNADGTRDFISSSNANVIATDSTQPPRSTEPIEPTTPLSPPPGGQPTPPPVLPILPVIPPMPPISEPTEPTTESTEPTTDSDDSDSTEPTESTSEPTEPTTESTEPTSLAPTRATSAPNTGEELPQTGFTVASVALASSAVLFLGAGAVLLLKKN